MKTAIIYTVLSVLNLIGFAVGAALLPARVPVHFDAAGLANRFGSPWEYIAFPAVTALMTLGLWVVALGRRGKKRTILAALFCGLGAVFACLGWMFFGIISQFRPGETMSIPFGAVTVLPCALLLVVLGNYMPRVRQNAFIGVRTSATMKSETVWMKANRAGGYAFFAAGLVSAAAAIVFSCVDAKPRLDFISIPVFLGCILAAAVFCVVYANSCYRRELRNGGGKTEQSDE